MSTSVNPSLDGTAIQELVGLGAQRGEIRIIDGVKGALPFVVIPSDHKVQPLSDLIYHPNQEFPVRKKANVRVLDGPSFCEYFKLFSDEDSRIFADETRASVVAILDYHHKGENQPRWGEHRVTLSLQFSEQWQRWTQASGKKMTQEEFAEFLEQNGIDISDPTPAAMMDVARDLQAKTDVEFGSGLRTQSGQVQLTYSETVKATVGKGNIEVPDRFKVFIPVYVSGESVFLNALLRFRINQGKLTFWFDLVRKEDAQRRAFVDVRDRIARELAVMVINGSPAA